MRQHTILFKIIEETAIKFEAFLIESINYWPQRINFIEINLNQALRLVIYEEQKTYIPIIIFFIFYF